MTTTPHPDPATAGQLVRTITQLAQHAMRAPDTATLIDELVDHVAALPGVRDVVVCQSIPRDDADLLVVRGSTFEHQGEPTPAGEWSRVIEGNGSIDERFGPGSPQPLALPPSEHATEVIAIPGEARAWGLVVLQSGGAELAEEVVEMAQASGQLAGAALTRLSREADLEHALAMNAQAEQMAHVGSYDWHVATDTNQWSDELYRIYGCEPQSFNADYGTFLSFIHPDDRERIQRIHERAYAEGGTYEMEERIVRRDGTERVLWSSGEVVLDRDGTPERMRGVCVDVTERRRSLEERAQHEQRLQAAELRRRHALQINDSIVQGLSAALLALEFGMTEEGVGALRATLTSARGLMSSLLDSAQAPGPGSLVREHPVESMLATTRLAQEGTSTGRARPVGSGHGPRVLVADDSADLRLVTRLALEREGYVVVGEVGDGRAAVEAARELRPDVVVLDLAMPQMDGFQALAILSSELPDTPVVVMSGFGDDEMQAQAQSLGAAAYIEKGSSAGPLLEALARLAPPPPRAHQMPVDPIDRSSDTAASDEGGSDLQRQLDHLVHELRTPVTVIRGLLHTLAARGSELDETATAHIHSTMNRNVGRMLELLERVADADRIAAGSLDVHVEPTDLGELCQRVVADAATTTGEHVISLTGPPKLVVSCDRQRVAEIVSNLLSNAAKYSPPSSPIKVSFGTDGDDVFVAVRDFGPGVPADARARLFGRFARLEASQPGLGLGLYLSRGLARAHGGELELAETGSGGSRFVLRLPRQPTAAATDSQPDLGSKSKAHELMQ